MSRIEPPAPNEPSPDVDELLRAFVQQPVLPLPPDEARQLRERVTRSLEQPRGRSSEAHGRPGRWRPWLLFAAAACLPVAIWASISRVHVGSARHVDSAFVTSLVGPALIVRDVERSIAGTGDTPLGPGDELRTGEGASARALLPTGAVVDVGPSARMRFSATGVGAAVRDRLELVAGRIQVSVPKLAAGDEVRIQTADAIVVVHGTKFSVERFAASGARTGGTRVAVTEGVVTVDTDRGQRTLTAGMELVTPEAPTADATPVPALTAVAADEPTAAPASNPRSTLGAENVLLSEAMRLRHDGQDAAALALVDAFVVRYPASPLTETARVERLRILEETGAKDRLGREAERYLADYPRGYARPEASRMVAVARAPSP